LLLSIRGQMADRPPTSGDVARRAGVSRATVSYVLNDVARSRISPETADRVREAAGALGYIPHAMARSLRIGRSTLVLVPRMTSPPGPMLDSFQEALEGRLAELGYTVVIHGDRHVRGVAGARVWASLRPVGIIVETRRLTQPALDVLRTAGATAILGLGWSTSRLVPTLVHDHSAVGGCAAEHLISTGHRALAAVVPRDPQLLDLGRERLGGFRAAAAGLTVERVDLAFDQADAALVAERWARGPRPSAVFAYNDEYGMLLMRALLDAGLGVPANVAVVGADDLPLCDLLRPRLTSVHLEAISSARSVAETLDGMIRGTLRRVPPLRLLSPRIVVRESA
jgi:DNA-binding LacI/PurR family transcriptional regulator